MNIIFHIGWPKTGTTAFQNLLMKNRALIEAQGFLYPETGRWPAGSHHSLALSLRPIKGYAVSESAEKVWSDLAEEIALKSQQRYYHTCLITSELFPLLFKYPSYLEFLKPHCAGMSILAVVREQVSFLRSLQRQLVMDPNIRMTARAAEFFSHAKAQYLYHEVLTDYRRSGIWSDLSVLAYDRDIVDRLADYLGLDIPRERIGEANVSRDYKVVEIMRQINATPIPLSLRAPVLQALVAASGHPGWAAPTRPEISQEEAAAIQAFYRVSNQNLKRDFGVQL